MAAQRSSVGTLLFLLLVLIHMTSTYQVFKIVMDFYNFDWVQLIAQTAQLISLIMFIYLLAKPALKPVKRFTIVGVCAFSIVMNLWAFCWGYEDFETFDLMVLWFVLIDLVPMIVYSVPADNALAKMAPFYQVGDSDDENEEGTTAEPERDIEQGGGGSSGGGNDGFAQPPESISRPVTPEEVRSGMPPPQSPTQF